ncbi:MAG TPA: hypothetical protein VJA21_23090 [Verrucomicrobiae bacterium]
MKILVKKALATLSVEDCLSLADDCEDAAAKLRVSMLTRAEKTYCKLEEITPEEFATAKAHQRRLAAR